MLVTFHRMRWQDQVTKDAFVSFENSVQVKQTCSNSKVKRTDKTTFPHRLEKGCPSRFQSTTAAVNCPQCICTSCFTSISATEKNNNVVIFQTRDIKNSKTLPNVSH